MNFPKKVSHEKRVNRQSNKTMLIKAANNAFVGFPMSALLNVVFTLPISIWYIGHNYPALYYPFVLGAPFVVASVARQFIIDWLMAVYEINVDPSYLIKVSIKKLLNKIKGSV